MKLLEHIWIPPLFTLNQAFSGWHFLPFLIPFVALAFCRWPKATVDRHQLWWLISLPLPWLLLSIWTSFNWHKDNAPLKGPPEAGWLALLSILLFIGLSVLICVRAKNARAVVISFSLPNLWVTLVGALLCIMATSGEWM